MFNLIRMNMYRMMRMKSAQVLILLLVGMALLAVEMASMDAASGDGELQMGEAGNTALGLTVTTEVAVDGEEVSGEEPAGFGIYSKAPEDVDGKKAPFLAYFCSDVASGLLLVFLTIMVVLFVNSEQTTGFVKNIAGQTKYKSLIYLAKFPAILCYTILYMFIYGAAQWMTMKVAYGSEIVFGVEKIGEYVPIIGLQILLHLAFLGGVAMVTSVTRSSVLGITTGILCCMGMTNYLSPLFKNWFDIDDIAQYFVMRNINQILAGAENTTMRTALCVGIVFAAGYILIGNICFVKRDVV